MQDVTKKGIKSRIGEQIIDGLSRGIDWACLLFFLLILLFCGYAIYDSTLIYEDATVAREIMEYVTESKTDGGRKIDFGGLRVEAPDIVGWIVLDGTNIDQPIVQGTNNSFYLSHDINKQANIAGSVYVDAYNNGDWSDAYTLLYGHNMNGDMMLGQLQRYHEDVFFENNKTGKLYTPEGTFDLQVEAEFVTSKDDNMVYNTMHMKDDAQAFIAYMNKIATHRRSFDETRKIVALSTCQGQSGMRQVVVVSYDPGKKN